MGEKEKLVNQLRDIFFRNPPTQQSVQPTVQEAASGKRPSIRAGTTYTPPPPVIPVAGDTVVTEQAFGQASNAGALATYSREDHTHGTPPNPGGGGGGHLGCGGGTLIAGVPLYNYEDHDLFNTSWCWWTATGLISTDAISGKPIWWFIPYKATGIIYVVVRSNSAPWGYWQQLISGGVGNSSLGIRHGPRTGAIMPSDITHHFMVKGAAFERTAQGSPNPLTNMSLSIGFWDYIQGFAAGCHGIGFAWHSAIPASFPNANFYATCNTAAGGIYAVDTGIPIYPVPCVGHKFNVVFRPASCTFYIDNVLVATITAAAAGLSYPIWSNGDYTLKYPTISMGTTDMNNWGSFKWKYPLIVAMDHNYGP